MVTVTYFLHQLLYKNVHTRPATRVPLPSSHLNNTHARTYMHRHSQEISPIKMNDLTIRKKKTNRGKENRGRSDNRGFGFAISS